MSVLPLIGCCCAATVATVEETTVDHLLSKHLLSLTFSVFGGTLTGTVLYFPEEGGMCEVLEKDLYAVLGARPSDSALQLKHRYQQLALQYHPDRLRLKEPSAVDSTSDKFLEIEAAWRVLSDQNTRQQYDLQCKAQELKQNWPLDSTISVENMRWDPEKRMHTDTCRCGGVFSITQEEVEEERRREWSDEEEETGLYVCCDSCSLCVCVKISVAHNNDNK